MRRTEKTIIPGSNRHMMQMALEHASPPSQSLTQRVSRLELLVKQLGFDEDVRIRIEHLTDKSFNPKNNENNGINI